MFSEEYLQERIAVARDLFTHMQTMYPWLKAITLPEPIDCETTERFWHGMQMLSLSGMSDLDAYAFITNNTWQLRRIPIRWLAWRVQPQAFARQLGKNYGEVAAYLEVHTAQWIMMRSKEVYHNPHWPIFATRKNGTDMVEIGCSHVGHLLLTCGPNYLLPVWVREPVKSEIQLWRKCKDWLQATAKPCSQRIIARQLRMIASK